VDKPSFKEILSQRVGKMLIKPKIMIIVPLKPVSREGGILTKILVAFSSNVKIIKDIAKESVIRRGLNFCDPETELPIIIGNSGNTQGARTVSIPAKNDEINSVSSIK
jgi:hypothetical protein